MQWWITGKEMPSSDPLRKGTSLFIQTEFSTRKMFEYKRSAAAPVYTS
jgi:hypothetical protein